MKGYVLFHFTFLYYKKRKEKLKIKKKASLIAFTFVNQKHRYVRFINQDLTAITHNIVKNICTWEFTELDLSCSFNWKHVSHVSLNLVFLVYKPR